MQKIYDLTDDMTHYIEEKRNWVRNHYSPENINEYDTVDGKLILLDTILKSDWIERHEKVKFQDLGVTLGDIFVQDMNFVWVVVEDEYGTDPAVQLPDTTIILFPLTIISKRVDRGEEVDIYELYEGLKEYINEIKKDA